MTQTPEDTEDKSIAAEPPKRAFAPMPASLPGPALPPKEGPMPAPTPGPSPAPMPTAAPAGAMMLTQAQLQQIIQAAMSGQAGAGAGTASSAPAEPLSEEDQRFVNALAAVHPAGRDLAVTRRESIGTNFELIMYSYTPATGMRRDGAALVYDDGDMIHVFTGGHS
jgi:hypothetical protein